MLALASCDARMPVSVRGIVDVALTARLPPHTCAVARTVFGQQTVPAKGLDGPSVKLRVRRTTSNK